MQGLAPDKVGDMMLVEAQAAESDVAQELALVEGTVPAPGEDMAQHGMKAALRRDNTDQRHDREDPRRDREDPLRSSNHRSGGVVSIVASIGTLPLRRVHPGAVRRPRLPPTEQKKPRTEADRSSW